MTAPPQPTPVFPGGMETAPEATPGGCGHGPCLCPIEPGKTYCSLACARAARADVDSGSCPCGHSGCTAHTSI